MAKLTTSDLSSLTNETSAVSTINNNNAAIEAAMEKTLSRDGTSPNEMHANLDMNSNRILNLPLPVADTEPARLVDVRAGITGPTGPTGATGAAGVSPGINQTYSTTTADADPGAGTFRLNNATPASATEGYFDNLDSSGNTVSSILDLWDDSTNTTKGYLYIVKTTDASKFVRFTVTGTVVDGTGYRKLTLSGGVGSGAFTNGDTFALTFVPAGDKGADGTLAASGTPTVGQIGVWVTSSSMKGVSITGLIKGNGASDPTAAVSGTDYAPATTGSGILKANGSGGFSTPGTGDTLTIGTIELGNAADTTVARASAGVISVEGVNLTPNLPVSSKSAAYTTVLADANTGIYHPSTDNNARTFTIDSNANVAYPVGTTLTFFNEINTVTISITADTLLMAGTGSTGSRSLAANGIATAWKVAATKWVISGTGLT